MTNKIRVEVCVGQVWQYKPTPGRKAMIHTQAGVSRRGAWPGKPTVMWDIVDDSGKVTRLAETTLRKEWALVSTAEAS